MVGVRVDVSTNFAGLDQLSRLVDAYPDEVQEGAYDVYVEDQDDIIRSVLQNPAPFTGKRDWQSGRQKTAYFATRGFGKGIPYARTGSLNDAWALGFNVDRNTISISLSNSSGKYRFVVGGLRLSDPPTQQRMHAQGGWKLVAPIIANDATVLRTHLIRRIRLIPKEFK